MRRGKSNGVNQRKTLPPLIRVSHFGHYIFGSESDLISQLHAILSRCSNGMSVMLEKMFGVRLVSKLRVILLMEENFNDDNKIVYGNRMLVNERKYKLMPGDVFSERNRMADDGGLAKVLFYDIVRPRRVRAGIASVDVANFYNRVAHSIASLVFK